MKRSLKLIMAALSALALPVLGWAEDVVYTWTGKTSAAMTESIDLTKYESIVVQIVFKSLGTYASVNDKDVALRIGSAEGVADGFGIKYKKGGGWGTYFFVGDTTSGNIATVGSTTNLTYNFTADVSEDGQTLNNISTITWTGSGGTTTSGSFTPTASQSLKTATLGYVTVNTSMPDDVTITITATPIPERATYVRTVSGEADWSADAAWAEETDAAATVTVPPDDNNVTLTVNADSTIAMNAAATLHELTIAGSAKATFAGENTLTADTTAINADTDVSAIKANLGAVTIEKDVTLTVGANVTASVANGANSGTIHVIGGTEEAPVVLNCGTAANDYAGAITIAADSVLRLHATGGNKVYNVIGNGGTSRVLLTSAQNWGVTNNANSKFNNCVLEIPQYVTGTTANAAFWLTPSKIGSDVHLVLNRQLTFENDSNAGTLNIASLSGASNIVANGSHTIKITNGAGKNYTGAIQGTHSVAKSGAGEQTFSGANTYSGTTTISGGILKVTGSLGSGTVTVNTDGTLTYAAESTPANTFTGDGTITADDCTVDFIKADLKDYTGAFAIANKGTLILPAGKEGTIAIPAEGTLKLVIADTVDSYDASETVTGEGAFMFVDSNGTQITEGVDGKKYTRPVVSVCKNENGTEYTSVEDAIKAGAKTITLVADSDEEVTLEPGVTLICGDYKLAIVRDEYGNALVNENGIYTYPTYVATVTGYQAGALTGYTTLQNAVTAAAGSMGTVTLLDDLTIEDAITVDNAGGWFNIDLGGKTLTATGSRAIYVKDVGILTILNGTIKATGVGIWICEKVTSADAEAFDFSGNPYGDACVMLDSTLTVNAGENCVLMYNGAVLTSAAKLTSTSTEYAAIQGTGLNANNATSITITGGEVTAANNHAIYHPQPGTLTITGGTISGKTGIEMRAGTLNMSAGTVTATGDYVAPDANSNGSTVEGAAIVLSQHTTGEAVVANIEGGTITCAEGGKTLVVANTTESTSDRIRAGIKSEVTIDLDAVAILVDTLMLAEANGTHVVTPIIATIGETPYPGIQTAVTAAEAKDTIILAPTYITLSAPVTVNKAVMIDLNGAVVYATGTAFSVAEGGDLTLITTDEDGSGTVVSDGVCIAVATGKVTIEGGLYNNKDAGATDLITVANGGTVEITGGDFVPGDQTDPLAVAEGTLTIKGGSFTEYDPKDFVAAGYETVSESRTWTDPESDTEQTYTVYIVQKVGSEITDTVRAALIAALGEEAAAAVTSVTNPEVAAAINGIITGPGTVKLDGTVATLIYEFKVTDISINEEGKVSVTVSLGEDQTFAKDAVVYLDMLDTAEDDLEAPTSAPGQRQATTTFTKGEGTQLFKVKVVLDNGL